MNLIRQFLKKPFESAFLSNIKDYVFSPRHLISFDFHSRASLFPNKNSLICPILSSTKLNLTNTESQFLSLNQKREYKQKVRLRKRCKSCYFVWRCGRIYVECTEHPRHKQHHVKSMLKGFDNISHGYDKNSPLNHLY